MTGMNGIPMEHGLLIAGALFVLGLAGLVARAEHPVRADVGRDHDERRRAGLRVRRLALAAGRRPDHVHPDPHLAASEASVGLALLLQLYRRFQTLDIDAAGQMKG